MDFSASIPIFVAVIALFAATAAGASATNAANATALTGARSTGSLLAAASGSLQYSCYLCHKRNSLMIRRCPIATDDCHVACVTLPTPSAPTPPAPPRGADNGNDDCYVMKLYPDRSWVVVDVVSCRAASGCYLQCGNEAAGDTTPARLRGTTFVPTGLPGFERCGA